MTLVNLDQAMRTILAEEIDKTFMTTNPGFDNKLVTFQVAISAMRRAYRLAESKEEMMKMIGEPAVRGVKEERIGGGGDGGGGSRIARGDNGRGR